MTITTLDEARALVGRTFERDGKRREIVWVDIVYGNIEYIPSEDWNRRTATARFDDFRKWLIKATEIQQGRSTP